MAFAGLWETWAPKDGGQIESCCIITTQANSFMEPIHDRMSVILNPDKWASQHERLANKLLFLIGTQETKSMRSWPVTRELNKSGL